MNKIKLSISLFAIFSLLILSCQSEKNDPITFRVTSTSSVGVFVGGRYDINGGPSITFVGSNLGSGVYEYETTLEDVDYLEVSASKNDKSDTLKIKIYRNGIKVKETSLDSLALNGAAYIYNLELDYKYDEESTSTTTTK
jgi:hypothetical protein